MLRQIPERGEEGSDTGGGEKAQIHAGKERG
jgi:hypothetical protein